VSRPAKIAIAILAALAVLVAVNTIVVDHETNGASVTVQGGRILKVPGGGELQITDTGPTRKGAPGAPIVLLHGFGASLHWWDRMMPALERRHRVIRVDLLGFGGSEKPRAGYAMEDQGRLVALALGRLDIEGAVLVGHSLGFAVAVAVARESSELVDRLVNIDEQTDPGYGGLPFLAKLGFVPVVGETIWRVAPDFAVRDGYESAFAPGYDLGDFGDQVVDDYRVMTYTSYDSSPSELDDYENQLSLSQRVQAAAIPLLVIFGTEDQLYDDPREAANAYERVQGARIQMIQGAGHSPNVEKPAETARLVLDFAAGVGGGTR
jgi:pimeloyl-ACP methyl ester carboxylesterase